MKLIDLDADKEYLLDGKYKVEPSVHCKECKYYLHTANKCLLTGRYGIFEEYYCNEAEREEQEHDT